MRRRHRPFSRKPSSIKLAHALNVAIKRKIPKARQPYYMCKLCRKYSLHKLKLMSSWIGSTDYEAIKKAGYTPPSLPPKDVSAYLHRLGIKR